MTDQSSEPEVYTYADEHENGQLRLSVSGEQMPLLPLPDDLLPPSTIGFLDAEGNRV